MPRPRPNRRRMRFPKPPLPSPWPNRECKPGKWARAKTRARASRFGQPGQPDQGDGQDQSAKSDSDTGQSNGGRTQASAGESTTGGEARAGNSFLLSLPPRDRDAFLQTQKEKYPQEYGPVMEQYLKNTSDTESK